MRVLVTGATGFIGRPLVQRLIAKGIEPIGLALPDDIASREPLSYTPKDVTYVAADLRDSARITELMAHIQPDRIIHLAAAGVADPAIDPHLALDQNVRATIDLIHAAFQNRHSGNSPSQLIVIRTPGESHPANAYTASKAAAWSFCQMYARRYHWPIMGAMIFQAYGPRQPKHTFVQAALRAAISGQDFAMTSGRQQRDWIYVDDVVSGLVATLGVDLSPGASVDLGTGVSTSLLEVAKAAYQLAGRGGAPAPGAIPDRPGESMRRLADLDRSAKLLGWSPQTKLKEGLQRVLDSLVS